MLGEGGSPEGEGVRVGDEVWKRFSFEQLCSDEGHRHKVVVGSHYWKIFGM